MVIIFFLSNILYLLLDLKNYVEIFLRYNTSPFFPAFKSQNSIHAACRTGNEKLTKIFFESKFMVSKSKNLRKKP